MVENEQTGITGLVVDPLVAIPVCRDERRIDNAGASKTAGQHKRLDMLLQSGVDRQTSAAGHPGNRAVLAQPQALAGQPLQISCSIDIALFPGHNRLCLFVLEPAQGCAGQATPAQRLLGKLKTAPSRTPALGQRWVMVLRLV